MEEGGVGGRRQENRQTEASQAMEWLAVCHYRNNVSAEWGCGKEESIGHIWCLEAQSAVCFMITLKVIVITGGMTLTPHTSIWLFLFQKRPCTDFINLEFSLSSLLVPFDVTQPPSKEMFSQLPPWGAMQFPFDQNTLIASLYPRWKWHFAKVISPVLHGPLLSCKEA